MKNKIKRGRVYKVFYLLQCINGFIRVEEEKPVLGQDEYEVWTGDEMWSLSGLDGVENVHHYRFEKEGKGWWRKRELAEEALREVLADLKPVAHTKIVNGVARTIYVPSNQKEGYKNV